MIAALKTGLICLLIIPLVSYAQISPNSATKAVATNPPSPKMIEVEVPDVGILEFPSWMSLDEIKAVLNKRFPPRQTKTAASFSELKTLDGGVYRSVRVLKAEPDGILVNYIPDGGGIGAAKLKFKNLPESLRKEFGYDARTATAYEIEQAKALGHLRLQMLADEQAAQARRRSNEMVEAKAELASLEAKLRALRSTAVAGAPSLSLGKGHWVKRKIDGGKLIQLEDGSLWQISPLDTIDTALWLPLDNVTVTEGKDPGYPYRLINTDDRHSASAKPLR